VKRSAGKLCLFGLIAQISAIIVLVIFEHTPWPWGAGTLPGGLSDAGAEDPIERTMMWQADVLSVTAGVGFAGTLLLLAGGITWLFLKITGYWNHPASDNCPN
jgi:hypothetical protein